MVGQQAGWKTPINHEEQLDLWWETSINLVKICEHTVIPKFDLCPNHIKYTSWLGPSWWVIKYPLEIMVSMRCERQNTSISSSIRIIHLRGCRKITSNRFFLSSWRGPNRSGRWWKFTEDIGYSIEMKADFHGSAVGETDVTSRKHETRQLFPYTEGEMNQRNQREWKYNSSPNNSGKNDQQNLGYCKLRHNQNRKGDIPLDG